MNITSYSIFLEKVKANKVLKSFSSLTILQISNYIFPFITVPYLVRVIGPDKFGLFNFASAFTAYFILITDYGFNLSAVREISVNKKSKNLYIIFNSVIAVKILLFLVSLIPLSFIIFTVPQFRTNYLVYIAAYLYVIGTVMFPVWFFQGMEEMKYITIINVVIKFILTCSIFLFITKESDFLFYVLINSFGSILIGIIGFVVSIRKFKIPLFIPSLTQINTQLKQSWYEFISIISISFYTVSNTFILGLFAGNTSVGYFAGADKIRMAVQSVVSVLLQSVYPHISLLFSQSKTEGLKYSRKLLKYSFLVAIIISLILGLFAESIVNIILGEAYKKSIIVLRIIAVVPLAISISNILGVQIMLNLGYKKEFLKIVGIMGFINLLISFILVPKYFEVGTSITVAVIEVLVTISMFIFLKNQGINLFKKHV